MADRLQRKTDRYQSLLAAGCADAEIDQSLDADDRGAAAECLEMAEAYLADGDHFRSNDDDVTALAAYSYGHGWLDAAIRMGFLQGTEEGDLFAN